MLGGLRTTRATGSAGLDWRFCDAATLSMVPGGATTDTKSIFLALGYRLLWGEVPG